MSLFFSLISKSIHMECKNSSYLVLFWRVCMRKSSAITIFDKSFCVICVLKALAFKSNNLFRFFNFLGPKCIVFEMITLSEFNFWVLNPLIVSRNCEPICLIKYPIITVNILKKLQSSLSRSFWRFENTSKLPNSIRPILYRYCYYGNNEAGKKTGNVFLFGIEERLNYMRTVWIDE